MMSGIQGGNFWTGFASGAISSVVSSVWGGGNINKTDSAWKGIGGAWGKETFGTIAFGTVSGGAGAALTGGNFWQGATTGLTVSLLNHAMHSSKDETYFPGKIKFKGLNKEELGDFSVIREEAVGNENPLFTPRNDILYDTDGFYLKNVTNSDENYWFKIGDGKRVEVTPSKNGNYGKYNIFYVPHKGGNLIEFMLPSSLGLKSVKSPHWTYNPFYNSSKWINPNK